MVGAANCWMGGRRGLAQKSYSPAAPPGDPAARVSSHFSGVRQLGFFDLSGLFAATFLVVFDHERHLIALVE